MPPHRAAMLTSLPLLSILLAAAPRIMSAQTNTPQQQTPYYPDNSVHPITSLPKPKQPPTETIPASGTPAPTLETAPHSGTTPIAPVTTGKPYPVPGANTTNTLEPAPPQPNPTIDAPLAANLPVEQQPSAPPAVQKAPRIKPFSKIAFEFKVGFAGIGVDVATPLAQHFNLRGGGNFFSYNGSYNDSGDIIAGDAKLRGGEFYLDYFPFHNGFRISPGLVINGNNLNAATRVPAGTEFDLGDGTYYSSNHGVDPVHGTAIFNLGRKVAPSFTVGFGNMIPRSNKHISFPFEVGFEYIGVPTLQLTLIGTVCDASTPPNCQKIDNDPDAQANLLKEQNDINSDIRFLRFYPILSQGISIKF
jgi:hypothetical protein